MLIEEMLEAFEKGTLGNGKDLEWLQLHQWQIGNAKDDLSMRHDDWTDLDAERMDELIRIDEYLTKCINYLNYESDYERSNKESLRRKPASFCGLRITSSI